MILNKQFQTPFQPPSPSPFPFPFLHFTVSFSCPNMTERSKYLYIMVDSSVYYLCTLRTIVANSIEFTLEYSHKLYITAASSMNYTLQ